MLIIKYYLRWILYLPVIIVSDCQRFYWLQNCLLIPLTPHGELCFILVIDALFRISEKEIICSIWFLGLFFFYIGDRFGKSHHPFSAHFCCSMWPWCNPSQTRLAQRCQNFSGSAGENESDPGLGWAGQTSFYPGSAGGWVTQYGVYPAPTAHQMVTCLIHSQNIRRQDKIFHVSISQCPTDPTFQPPQSSHRMNNLSLWTPNHCKCRLSSIVSRLCPLATPIKFIQIGLEYWQSIWA